MTEPTVGTPREPSDAAGVAFERPLVSQVSDLAVQVPGIADSTVEAGLELKARSQWSYARQRFLRHRLAMAGLVGLIFFFIVGIFANYIAPYPIDHIDLEHVMIAPTVSGNHFLGTDEVGRDFLSR